MIVVLRAVNRKRLEFVRGIEPKIITSASGEKLVVLTLTETEWQRLEAKLNEDLPMPAFASIGAGESDLNGADSEAWLQRN
jgi:hypothetical protein